MHFTTIAFLWIALLVQSHITTGIPSGATSGSASTVTTGSSSGGTRDPTSTVTTGSSSGATSGSASTVTTGSSSGATSGSASTVTTGSSSGATSGPTSTVTTGSTSVATSGPASTVTTGLTSVATSGPTSTVITGTTSGATSGPISTVITGPTSGDVSTTTSASSPSTSTSSPTTTSPGQFPTEKPDLENAVYTFNFTLSINAKYSDTIKDNVTFTKSLTETLLAHVFISVPGLSFSFTFRSGSIKCDIKTKIKNSDLTANGTNITSVVDDIIQNVKDNKDELNTTLGSINGTDFVENIESEKLRFEENRCKYTAVNCSALNEYTCGASGEGICKHKCDMQNGFCGENGQCFYDINNEVLACKCDKTSFTVYHGSQCKEKTATIEYILAMSLGIGGGVVLILSFVIICMCVRKKRDEKLLNVSKYDGSEWDASINEVALKDLSFRPSDKTSPLQGKYHRTPGHVNQAYDPVGSNGDRGFKQSMYFPSESERGVGANTMETNVPSYATIDTTADYSIKRPTFSAQPNEVYSSTYLQKTPDSVTDTPRSSIMDMKTTL